MLLLITAIALYLLPGFGLIFLLVAPPPILKLKSFNRYLALLFFWPLIFSPKFNRWLTKYANTGYNP